jgi:hypothetical protein
MLSHPIALSSVSIRLLGNFCGGVAL